MGEHLSGRKCLPQLSIQQGDTFLLNFEYKEDDIPAVLPEGYDLIAGIYDEKDTLIQSGKLSEGTIRLLENGLYQMTVTHESSLRIKDRVVLELTITDSELTVVDHASDVVYINGDYRRNNMLLR